MDGDNFGKTSKIMLIIKADNVDRFGHTEFMHGH